MDFIEACELIKRLVDDKVYKAIIKYHPTVPYSFKFERKCKQYSPIDIIYMHVFQVDKPKAFHQMYNALDMPSPEIIQLEQLSSGTWKKLPEKLQGIYHVRREQFTSITGIVVK